MHSNTTKEILAVLVADAKELQSETQRLLSSPVQLEPSTRARMEDLKVRCLDLVVKIEAYQAEDAQVETPRAKEHPSTVAAHATKKEETAPAKSSTHR